MPLEFTTLSNQTTTVSDDAIQQLAQTLRGPLLQPEDDAYPEARIIQNGMIDRKPGLIAQCTGAADVMDAVDFAREHGILTAVRGGGHSVAGHCTCDGGLMIDLSQMNGVHVDPDTRTARVEGGATWGEVDREAQAFGLAVPGGIISTTGVAGLTLGGGIGWLHRKWGLTCDNLRSADVVTPDGKRIRASGRENEDLFWAIRGGGGNFGIVTSFEFDAHPLGPVVACAAPIYAASDGEEVLRRWRDWTLDAPEEVTSRAMFWWLPDAELLPPAVRDQDVLILAALYVGDPETGEEVLRPLREFAEPLADLSGQQPYRKFQSDFDPLFPKGELCSYWKSTYLDGLSDQALDFALELARNRPTPRTMVHIPQMGGAAARVAPDSTAFGDRSAEYMLSVDGNWMDPSHEKDVVAWVRDAVVRAQELDDAKGAYLNFSSDPASRSGEVVDSAYGDNLDRLAALKARFDEDNLLRLNSNVVPA